MDKGKPLSREEQAVRQIMARELYKRPNIYMEVFAARLLAALSPTDAVVEADLNREAFTKMGLDRNFVMHLADKIRLYAIVKRGNHDMATLEKVMPL